MAVTCFDLSSSMTGRESRGRHSWQPGLVDWAVFAEEKWRAALGLVLTEAHVAFLFTQMQIKVFNRPSIEKN